MLCGSLEGVMELISDTLTGSTSIEVRVRGPRGTNKACFFFMEELLGIVDQVCNHLLSLFQVLLELLFDTRTPYRKVVFLFVRNTKVKTLKVYMVQD
jgi:hypothetical protein